MSLIGSSILAGSAANQGYTIEKSLQFNGTDEYLSRTFTAGSRTTWTWSGWVKASSVSGNRCLFCAETNQTGSGTYGVIRFVSGSIEFFDYTNGTFNAYAYTESLHRDPSAWYHIVVAVDTTSPASENRVKIYANGVEVDKIDYTTFPIGYNGQFNNALTHQIGTALVASQYFDGYLADVHFIDGQALDPTYFGVTSDNYSQWVPKKYAGTYGTNGFFLNFKGTYYEDKSGNGNDWTANNLASTDVVNDTPNNNFCTWNPLAGTGSGVTGYGWTLTDGGLDFTATNAATYSNTITSTFAVTSGKWYLEVTIGSSPAGGHPIIGVIETEDISLATSTSNFQTATYISTVRATDGQKSVFGSTSVAAYGSSLAAGDILNIAIDGDNGKIWWGKNGTWFNSGAPESGTNAGDTFTAGRSLSAICIAYNANGTHTLNAGQKSFTYTPPTGFNTLCTDNLPEPTVTPGEHFNSVLYAGNDGATATKSVTGVGFQPDVVWIKNRTATSNHNLFTSTLGPQANTALLPNATNTPLNRGFKSYDSDGFTLTNLGHNDNNEESYVSWHWKAGGSSTTVNTDGTTSSNTSVNTSAGFSIVSFNAGAAGNHTVGHGLGVTPELIIMKDLDSSGYGNWLVFHSDVCTSTSNYLLLNGTGALGSVSNSWGSALPTSTVFGFGSNVNVAANDDIVAYCFASVEGYSKFGSYVGNGSTDGPFIYTGFRPAWVMVKRTDSTGHWPIVDTARDPYNPTDEGLIASTSDPQGTGYTIDYLSNGFKLRLSGTAYNASGGTYIYAAFAENPFKYANARGTSFDKFTAPSDSALTIPQSARFDAGYLVTSNNPYNSDSSTWTWSAWVKQGYLNNDQWFFGGYYNTSNFTGITFNSGSGLNAYQKNSGSVVWQVRESAVYRDYSAWQHLVVTYDSNHATSSERVRLYVNGTRMTNLASASYPSSGQASWMNGASTNHNYGRSLTTGNSQFKGYIAEANFIDGQALGPESFGYQDPTTKQWLPRTYDDFGPEIDYGPNGHRLDFQSGAMGTDRTGNGRTFSLVSMDSTNDVTLDSPSNNFATANQLVLRGVGIDLSEGSLYVNRNSAGFGNIAATIGVSSGKWYWEFLNDSASSTMIGVDSEIDPTDFVGSTSSGYGYYSNDGNKYNSSSSSSYGDTFTTGDIIGVALDMDNGKIWFAKNGTWQSSGDPAAGTNEAFSGLTGTYLPQFSLYNSGGDGYINFGQDSSFAGRLTRQSNQDGNSIGDFYYTPPTGFLALCTDNLPSPTIANGRDYFNTVLYNGTGSSQSITGVGFQPNLVWSKSRNIAENHGLYDNVRGVTQALYSNLINAEGYDPGVSSFDSDGFSLGGSTINASGYTYAAWNWKAGDSTVVNTTGTLSANVSASTTSGVSIATFTVPTTGSSWTLGHGLGAAPKFIIQKSRSGTSNWGVYHASVGETKGLYLNGTSAEFNASGFWNNTAPTSSVWSIGTSLQDTSDVNVVSWLFSEVEGFSAFGSYTGNGSTDGPFVYTGFRPAFVLVKAYSTAGYSWNIIDTAREAYNTQGLYLFTNTNGTEGSGSYVDILSNGFKLRNAGAGVNGSGISYIYAAFAENPFKHASAR